MIRMLQKKFVLTAMIAITALILLLLGAVNIGNVVLTSRETTQTLQTISDMTEKSLPQGNTSQGEATAPADGTDSKKIPQEIGKQESEGGAAPTFAGGQQKNDSDKVMGSNFFVVWFDADGKVSDTDTTRTSSVTNEEAQTLAEQLCKEEKTDGTTGKYRYQITVSKQDGRTQVVCLDVSDERLSCVRVLLLSAAIGLLCWCASLLLVILLSRKAIRPIAENIEKQKQFVTNAGHEIKTPLAIIQSNTEAMELFKGENKWSKNIKEQTGRLAELMNRMLMLARLEEGNLKPVPVTFALDGLVKELLHGFEQPMEMKQITWQTELEEAKVCADQMQIGQLISILLDNAVKYTPEQGKIWITVSQKEKKTCLSVENTCTEQPKAAPEQLFDRFYRGNEARTQSSGGYGIGLSAAKAIAQANQGQLKASYIEKDKIRFSLIF